MNRWRSLSGGWESETEDIICKGSFDEEWVAKIFQAAARSPSGKVPWVLTVNHYKRKESDPDYTLVVPVEETEPRNEYNQERNP